MVDTAMLLGAKNKSQVETEMWDVIALEAQIAHATHDPQMGEKKQSWYLYLKAFADVANQVSDDEVELLSIESKENVDFLQAILWCKHSPSRWVSECKKAAKWSPKKICGKWTNYE